MARRKRRKWFLYLILGLVVLGGLAVARQRLGGKFAGQTSAKERNELKIQTAKAETGNVQVVVREIGTIEPAEKVEVKAPVSGRIVDLFADEGATVQRDQPLAEIAPDITQSQRMTQVQAALNRARLRYQDAERTYLSAQQLHAQGFYSRDQLLAAKLARDTTQQDLRTAQLDYENFQQQGIDMSRLQNSILYSQWDGVVITRGVEKGEMVLDGTTSFNAGTIIFEIADLTTMLINASINEVDIGKVSIGAAVDITVDAFPKEVYTGAVVHISPAARKLTASEIRVFDLKISIDQENTRLRSGMTANINIKGESRDNVLTVPIESVFHQEARDIVYVNRQQAAPPTSRAASAANPSPAAPSPAATPAASPADKPASAETAGKDAVKPEDAWRAQFDEREVQVGLVDETKAEIVSGLSLGEAVALENPTVKREPERSRY